MAKQTTTTAELKKELKGRLTQINKQNKEVVKLSKDKELLKKEIKDLNLLIDRQRIDIKSYKAVVTEHKKMLEEVNKEVNRLTNKPKLTTIRGNFYNKEKAELFIKNNCGDKINYTYKITENTEYPGCYFVEQTERS